MLPTKWRLFQVVCIVQMLMAAFHVVYSFFLMLTSNRAFLYGLEVIAFISIVLFANLGSSILNYNYPDKPVIDRQRKQFNLFYVVNFFVLSFLLSLLYIEVRNIAFIFLGEWKIDNLFWFLLPSIVYLAIVTGQIILLVGMFKLRREIFQRFYAEANKLASEEA